jgi:predicted permease
VYLDQLVQEVRGLSSVAAVGLTDALPLGDNFGWRRWGVEVPDNPHEEASPQEPLVRMVDAGYFATLGIPLRSGRGFTDADLPGSEPVIIINEKLAEIVWPGGDALGRTMVAGGTARRVVGVVGATRYFALDRDVEPEMYMPVGQPGGFSSVDLVVRGSVPPETLVADLRAALRRADPTLPTANVRTMEQLVDQSLFVRRFVVLLVAAFGIFGLLLSALGIYAVISYSVSQRTQEIAIRMALGATAGAVAGRILRETGGLAVAGIAIGLPLAWAATRAIQGLLFGVAPTDPATLVSVLVVLAGVVALAGYLPARRATRVDPAIALKPR